MSFLFILDFCFYFGNPSAAHHRREKGSLTNAPPFLLAPSDGFIYKRCNNEHYTHQYQGINTWTAGSGQIVVHNLVGYIHFSDLLKGNADNIQTRQDFITNLAIVACFVTETEPTFCVIQLLSRWSFQLLHVVRNMLPEDDALDNACLEEKFAIGVRHFRGDQTTLFIK